jgi:glycosyltransferase involved in cell wall biosynthesis
VPLKIGFDAGPLLDPPTGVGRYTSELATALEARDVELRRFAVAFGGDVPSGVERMRLPARVARRAWMRWGKPRIDRLVAGADLVHATNFVLPPSSLPGVVTVHDLSFLRSDVFPGGESLRALVPWSVRRAAAVITPTRAVAGELSERYGVSEDKIFVTPEGVSEMFFGASPLSDTALGKMGIPGPYALAVGTLEPRKNLPRLLAAWDASGLTGEGWRLVLAGPKGWGAELPETPGVILAGYVADETLPGLLAGASFFCYPSLYEGFGLPPLEAMAAGTPVLAGDHAVSREVLGESASLVDPEDTEALVQGLGLLAGDETLRRSFAVAGRARAASFTWAATAKATIEAYRYVL